MTNHTKPEWAYDDTLNCEVTTIERGGETYRIRAVRDDYPANPFEDGDCNWPIVVRSPDAFRGFQTYLLGEVKLGTEYHIELDMFSDAQLVHDQHAICRALDVDHFTLLDTRYERDPERLRSLLTEMLLGMRISDLLSTYAKLYQLAGIPALCKTVNGYSQGDWAEVLVVATRQAQDKFGCTEPPSLEDLESTADLYGWWAFGDVYGFIVEKQVEPEDPPAECQNCDWEGLESELYLLADVHQRVAPGEVMPAGECPECGAVAHLKDDEEPEWEEVHDGSCWGYYGPDHDKSGLTEAAMEAIPDE